MKQFKLFIQVLAIICILAALPACSTHGKGDKGEEDGLSEADLNAQREGRYGSGAIPTAEGEGIFRDIHFDYDSSRVTDSSRGDLEYNARVLREQQEVRVQLEGHTDERGTAEYNLQLGSARARAVKEVLISLGIASNRLETISYGEEVPLDQGHNEDAWTRNRRVHFSAFRDLPAR